MPEILVKNIANADKLRTFLDGSNRSVVILESAIIGKGTYLPGWRWSLHAGAQTGQKSQRHIGYILSGKMMSKEQNGKEVLLGPDDAFEMGPNHDAWVVGDEPCVALDFQKTDSASLKKGD